MSKFFRDEILELLFRNVNVVYRFGYLRSHSGAKPLTVASPLHHMTHITLTGSRTEKHKMELTQCKAPRFWIAQHVRTIQHLAKYARSLRHFEYVPQGEDIKVADLTSSRYYFEDLAKAVGELVWEEVGMLERITVFTKTKMLLGLGKMNGKQRDERVKEAQQWVWEELWEQARLPDHVLDSKEANAEGGA